MAYKALIMGPPYTTISLDDLVGSLIAVFEGQPGSTGPQLVSQPFTCCRVDFEDGWWLAIAFSSAEHVAIEAREIADRYADTVERQAALRSCTWRYEVITAEDPLMEHFNDYILVVQQLLESPGAIAFETASETFFQA